MSKQKKNNSSVIRKQLAKSTVVPISTRAHPFSKSNWLKSPFYTFFTLRLIHVTHYLDSHSFKSFFDGTDEIRIPCVTALHFKTFISPQDEQSLESGDLIILKKASAFKAQGEPTDTDCPLNQCKWTSTTGRQSFGLT